MLKQVAVVHVSTGGYEGILAGWSCRVTRATNKPLTANLTQKFCFVAHSQPVTTVCSVGANLVSGSSDEQLKVYDTVLLREAGTLTGHDGTINDISFYNDTHFVSCADDATLRIWALEECELLKVMPGHSGPVTGVAVHPSGRLALSTGHDRTLRTWDLMKGKPVHVLKRKAGTTFVRWSPSGDSFAVADLYGGVAVFLTQTGKEVCRFKFEGRITAMQFVGEKAIAIAGHQPTVRIFCTSTGACTGMIQAHAERVRDMAVVQPFDDLFLVVTVDSTGNVKMWEVPKSCLVGRAEGADGDDSDVAVVDESTLLATAHVESRLTCVTATRADLVFPAVLPDTEGTAAAGKKRRRAAQDSKAPKHGSDGSGSDDGGNASDGDGDGDGDGGEAGRVETKRPINRKSARPKQRAAAAAQPKRTDKRGGKSTGTTKKQRKAP